MKVPVVLCQGCTSALGKRRLAMLSGGIVMAGISKKVSSRWMSQKPSNELAQSRAPEYCSMTDRDTYAVTNRRSRHSKRPSPEVIRLPSQV